jgi:hypothetical protein
MLMAGLIFIPTVWMTFLIQYSVGFDSLFLETIITKVLGQYHRL